MFNSEIKHLLIKLMDCRQSLFSVVKAGTGGVLPNGLVRGLECIMGLGFKILG